MLDTVADLTRMIAAQEVRIQRLERDAHLLAEESQRVRDAILEQAELTA